MSDIVKVDNDEIEPIGEDFLTETERKLHKKTLLLREKIIDEMTDNGTNIPTSTSEIRVLKELMESLDNRINNDRKARIDRERDKDNRATKELIAETLKMVSMNNEIANGKTIEELPDVFVPDDDEIVEGELDIDPDPINIEDIMGEKGDDDESDS